MNNRSKKIRLGIFIIVSSALLLFLVVYFTARELFEKSDTYYVNFHDVSVSGMEIGSPVKYLGINVGTISDIRINPQDITSIIAELSLKQGTPIKEDAKADIVSLGITGMKAIEIRGGTNEADLLKPGSYIQPGSSLTSEITGKAEIIAEKAEKVLNNLQMFTHPDTLAKITTTLVKFSKMADDADRAILRLDTIVGQNKKDIGSTIKNANKISASILETSSTLEETMTRIDQLVQSDSIHDIIGNAREISQKLKETNITQLIDDLAGVVAQTKELLIKVDDDINKGTKGLVETQELLQSTLRNLEEASRKINNNPSVLIRKTKVKNLPDDKLKD
ncbi:MAG: mammalian cell entry protein [Anaerophaga sp.]|nr:mammalian cell entry protein [Anaerophaga sp.]